MEASFPFMYQGMVSATERDQVLLRVIAALGEAVHMVHISGEHRPPYPSWDMSRQLASVGTVRQVDCLSVAFGLGDQMIRDQGAVEPRDYGDEDYNNCQASDARDPRHGGQRNGKSRWVMPLR